MSSENRKVREGVRVKRRDRGNRTTYSRGGEGRPVLLEAATEMQDHVLR